jgi:ferredoxin
VNCHRFPPGHFEDRCTRCGACVDACPESILRRGSGGFPTVDFTASACTFCTARVAAQQRVGAIAMQVPR